MHKSRHFYELVDEQNLEAYFQCHRSQLKFTRTRKKITCQIYWKIAIMAMFSSMDHDQEDLVSMRVQNFISGSAQNMYPTRSLENR